MSELEDKISSILNDPQELSKIAGLAQSLMGGGLMPDAPQKQEKEPEPMLQKLMSGLGLHAGGNNSNTAMLRAICPYLDEKRGRKLERAIRMSEMAKIARNFLKEQGGDGYGHE